MTYRRVLEILLWAVKGVTLGLTLLLFLWIFNKYFSPLGKLTVVYDFKDDSEYISHLEPWQRLLPPEELNGDWVQSIKDDLVYFDVKSPRWFQKANVEITFQNQDQPIIEIGARVKGNEKGYFDKSLQNKLIDNLTWSKITEGEVSLYQKEEKYDSINDFLINFPDNEIIGEYFYRLPEKKIIPGYEKNNQKTVISSSLRGQFTIYTYLKDENLDFTFTKIDLNRYQGPDTVKVEVYEQKSGKNIHTLDIPDDGVEGITGLLSQEQNLSFSLENLEEGVYRIELKGNQDFLISQISMAEHLIIFSRNIFLADNEEYFKDVIPGSKPTIIFTDASKIIMKTSHPSSLQKITAGNQKLNIQEINKNYAVHLSGLSKLSVPKNDLLLESDGFFSFSEEQYFNPNPSNIVAIRNDTDMESLDYVICRYDPSQSQKEWYRKENVFELVNLYQNKEGKYRFRLVAPGLGESGETISLSEIKVTFEKPPITIYNFFPKLKNFISRKIKEI